MIGLTSRKIEILRAIIYLTEQKGFPPTVRELCEYIGLKSPGTMQAHLIELKRKGFITWEPNTPRTIRVVKHEEYITKVFFP